MSEPLTFLHVNCFSFKSVSQKHRHEIAFLCVFLISSSSVPVKQGIGMFLQSIEIVMGRGERKTACYWVLPLDQVSGHVFSFMLPCDNAGRVCCRFTGR